MYRTKESQEKKRRASQAATRRSLRASMIAIEQESKRLAKGKLISDEMVKKGQLPYLDKQMQGYIQNSLKGVLGHLGNIAGVVAKRGEELNELKEEGIVIVGGIIMEDHPERKRLRAHSLSPPSSSAIPQAQRS